MGNRFAIAAAAACVAAIAMATFSPRAAAGRYEIRDLGANLEPEALNNSAQILALTPPVLDDLGQTAVTPGVLYRLDPDGTRITIVSGSNIRGQDINNRGEVIANIFASPIDFAHVTPLRTDAAGQVVPLPTGMNASLSGINDVGEVVGNETVDFSTLPLTIQPFRLDAAGRRTNIPFQAVTAINNRGEVVADNFVYENVRGEVIENDISVLDSSGRVLHAFTLPNPDASPITLTDSGTILASGQTRDIEPDVFVVDPSGHATHIDAVTNLNFSVGRMNNLGDFVGFAQGFNETPPEAYLFHAGKLERLDPLLANADGWNLETASDINDRGQIIGVGALDGVDHAFLLTPIATAAIPLPSALPATMVMISAGAALMAMRRAKWREAAAAITRRPDARSSSLPECRG